jgi:methyl-accepting chemotaxis protein
MKNSLMDMEAAHAGGAGGGFAVATGEIRWLAESSNQQSAAINAALKKIKASIDKTGASAESAPGKFGSIDSGVKTVAAREGAIQRDMDAQVRGGGETLGAARAVSALTDAAARVVEEALAENEKVIKESEALKAEAAEMTDGMSGMAVGTG